MVAARLKQHRAASRELYILSIRASCFSQTDFENGAKRWMTRANDDDIS
jgi:hypothetical protein